LLRSALPEKVRADQAFIQTWFNELFVRWRMIAQCVSGQLEGRHTILSSFGFAHTPPACVSRIESPSAKICTASLAISAFDL
jgi:hypothetical protein